MENVLKTRQEVEKSLTWDLTAIFKTEEDFENALNVLKRDVENLVENYQGKLQSASSINGCLDHLGKIYEGISKAANYVSLALSVDQGNAQVQTVYMRFNGIYADLQSKLSFVRSEILQADEGIIKEAIATSKANANYLRELLVYKPHALEPAVEKTLSALFQTLSAPYEIYNQTKLVDMNFKPFEVNGKEFPLSFNLFEDEWEFESNTEVRRAAFKAFSEKLGEYQNTIAALYQTEVLKEKTIASLRGFESVFDYLLLEQKVERDLYNRQIDVIMEKLAPYMRKYAQLLKRIHNLDELTFADLKIDVDPNFEPHVSFEEAKTQLMEGLGILGEDYSEMVKRSFDERWVDFAQNKGKSTGAFCATPYGVHPYILMTFSHKMREVFTLAHELGHAGHFSMMHEKQNIFNSEPSLYFIEAPATMNEMLMANYLLKQTDEPRFKRWVLSTIVSKTYYHNFVTHLLEAAYQREVYKIIDEGGSVQAGTLNAIKRQVLEKFWGEDVVINEGAELTWMRQPHYYMGLYSYTYSAGLTIATEVSQRILKEGQSAIEDWRKVLEAGGTKSPLELAQMAKVDLSTEGPLLHTIEHIGSMIDEIIRLTEEIERNK